MAAAAPSPVKVVRGESAANKLIGNQNTMVLYVTGAPAQMLYGNILSRALPFDETNKVRVLQKMGESVSCFRFEDRSERKPSFKCEITVESGKVLPPAQG